MFEKLLRKTKFFRRENLLFRIFGPWKGNNRLLASKRAQVCQNFIFFSLEYIILESFLLKKNSYPFRKLPEKNSAFLSEVLISACSSKLILAVIITFWRFFLDKTLLFFHHLWTLPLKKISDFIETFWNWLSKMDPWEIIFFWKNCFFFKRFRTTSNKPCLCFSFNFPQ